MGLLLFFLLLPFLFLVFSENTLVFFGLYSDLCSCSVVSFFDFPFGLVLFHLFILFWCWPCASFLLVFC